MLLYRSSRSISLLLVALQNQWSLFDDHVFSKGQIPAFPPLSLTTIPPRRKIAYLPSRGRDRIMLHHLFFWNKLSDMSVTQSQRICEDIGGCQTTDTDNFSVDASEKYAGDAASLPALKMGLTASW